RVRSCSRYLTAAATSPGRGVNPYPASLPAYQSSHPGSSLAAARASAAVASPSRKTSTGRTGASSPVSSATNALTASSLQPIASSEGTNGTSASATTTSKRLARADRANREAAASSMAGSTRPVVSKQAATSPNSGRVKISSSAK